MCEDSLVARCMSTGGADSCVSAEIAGDMSGSSSITQCYWSEEISEDACNCADNGTANVTDSYSFNKDFTLNDGRNTPLLAALSTEEGEEGGTWIGNRGGTRDPLCGE